VIGSELAPHDKREGFDGDPSAPPQLIDEDIVTTALSLLNHENDRVTLAAQFRVFNRCLHGAALDRLLTTHFHNDESRVRVKEALDCSAKWTRDTDVGPAIADHIPYKKATRWPSRHDEKFQDM